MGHLVLDPSQDTDLQTAGTANIVVTATGFPTATVSQTLLAGAVDSLVVAQAPVLALTGGNTTAKTMTTQPIIALKDQYNNTCTTGVSATANVVVTKKGESTPAGALVSSPISTTKAAVAGVATFTDLTVAAGDTAAITDLDLTFTCGVVTVDVDGLTAATV